MSTKKWLQLSDIHFGSPDNHSIETMREHFLEKCNQLQGIDYLFLTGDLRYSKDHPDEYPVGTINFLQNIQKSLGVLPSNTFMVPGNHDISRDDAREGIIEKIKRQYYPSRTISNEYTQYLDLNRQSYLNLYIQVCGTDRKENHFFISESDLNIIHINTAILSSKDGEDKSLVIDMLALRRALDGIDKTKPAIAIAHHTFDCLEDSEQEQLEHLLKQFNTVLFLCGHKHIARYRNINFVKPYTNLWEYVCGTNMESSLNEKLVDIGFFVGEINTKSKSGYVEAYKWSERLNDWVLNNEFSFPQMGANDGRHYFPERESANSYDDNLLESAREKYQIYLKSECSEILLDGLPVDKEAGSKTIALEKLFVPLRFSDSSYREMIDDRYNKSPREKINIIPTEGTFKQVVFSVPGGGKTTWMKRLASVYGSGNFGIIEDHLPERTLFPIWIKCRQFKGGTPLSILEMIHSIPERAGFGSDERLKKEFFDIVHRNIQKGTALVLIDGLDEVGGAANRQEFIGKLNRFADEYDKANIIITSRSVGYEQVAKNLSINFTHYEIKPLNKEDITRLCIGWHKIFYRDSQEIITEAEELSETIVNTDRIFKLAQTPVLLTTLLLIKRWVGKLPEKRAGLYSEAIQVLLYTWGAAARQTDHPINLDEARPLLAYLAFCMMFQGKPQQTIGKTELKKTLFEAQKKLSHIFTTASEAEVDIFIERVENRSELLVMRGYRPLDNDSDSDEIEEVYEFSHLTIQEYLAAYAIAHEYYPGVTLGSRISDCFEGILEEKDVREVVLLTSVLTNWRGAEEIADALLNRLSDIRKQRLIDRYDRIVYIVELLMQMIADEAPLTLIFRERIYKACFVDCSINNKSINGIMAVYSSKYGEELKKVLEPLREDTWVPVFRLIELRKKPDFSVYTYYFENRHSDKLIDLIRLLENATWLGENWTGKIPENIQDIKASLVDLCASEDTQIAKTVISALYFIGESDDIIFTGELLKLLLNLFNQGSDRIRIANKFPVTQDTIIHLQGASIIESRKHELEKSMREENSVENLLGIFWFGILCGAWDIVTVIQMSKDFSTADYISKSDSERLCNRMKSYLSILQESNAILTENEDLVKEYLDELELQMQAKKKNDIFDW